MEENKANTSTCVCNSVQFPCHKQCLHGNRELTCSTNTMSKVKAKLPAVMAKGKPMKRQSSTHSSKRWPTISEQGAKISARVRGGNSLERT